MYQNIPANLEDYVFVVTSWGNGHKSETYFGFIESAYRFEQEERAKGRNTKCIAEYSPIEEVEE